MHTFGTLFVAGLRGHRAAVCFFIVVFVLDSWCNKETTSANKLFWSDFSGVHVEGKKTYIYCT